MSINNEALTQDELNIINDVAAREAATIAECWSTLLSKEVSVTAEDAAVSLSDDFITEEPFPLVFTRIAFAGDIKGDSYIIFPEVDAVTVAALLAMSDEDEVKQKREAPSYGADDADAFKEAINVMLGNIGIALRGHLEKELSLSQQESNHISDDGGMLVLRNSLPDESYVVVRFVVKIGDYEDAVVNRLYSIGLAKALCGAEPEAVDDSVGAVQKSGKKETEKETLERVFKILVPVIVNVAEKKMPIEEIIRFSPGYIIQFNKNSDELLELRVNNKKLADGEAITIEERFGLQIKKITSLETKIKAFRTNDY